MRNLAILLSTTAFLFAPCPSKAEVNNTIADEMAEPPEGPNGPVPLPPPGPGEIRLEGNMIRGGQMNVPLPKDGWLHIRYTGMLCPYAGGKYLTFTQEGVRIYLSIDEGPRWLVGVKVTGSADVAAVAEALKEESPLQLVLWCTCCLPSEFGKLKELQKIAYLRHVLHPHSIPATPAMYVVEFNDLRGLSRLTSLTSLDLRVGPGLTDLRPLARLTKLTSLSLRGCEGLTDLTPLAKLKRLESLDLSLFNRFCAPNSFRVWPRSGSIPRWPNNWPDTALSA